MRIVLSLNRIRQAIKTSRSMRDMLLMLDLSATNGNYRTYREFIKNNNVDVSHWNFHFCNEKQSKAKSLQEKLQNGSKAKSRLLKKLLIESGMMKEKCSICPTGAQWQGNKLVLVLDHISGDSMDNRIENLRLLCPNCNSQQPTFCRKKGKKKAPLWECLSCGGAFAKGSLRESKCLDCRKKNFEKRVLQQKTCACGEAKGARAKRCSLCASKAITEKAEKARKFHVSKEELERMVWEMPTSSVADKIGVSDKAVEKRCKKLGINKPPRGYWAKKAAGKI